MQCNDRRAVVLAAPEGHRICKIDNVCIEFRNNSGEPDVVPDVSTYGCIAELHYMTVKASIAYRFNRPQAVLLPRGSDQMHCCYLIARKQATSKIDAMALYSRQLAR
jgi:hypothetical protein